MVDVETYSNGKAATKINEHVFDFEITTVKEAQRLNISYDNNGVTVSYDVFVTFNPDATDEDRAALLAKINEGKAVETKDISLQTAIELAEAGNNKTSLKEQLVAHVSNIEQALQNNEEILETIKAATLNYVKSTDLTNSFDSSFANFFSSPQTYSVDNNNYIRVNVQNTLSLKLTVNEVNGKVVGYVKNDAGSITHFIMDYKVADDFNTPVISQVSYASGGYVGRHDQYIVINQDATIEAREALKNAINDAELIVNKTVQLTNALNKAKEVNNLLSRNAVLIEMTKALRTAITNNENGGTTTPVGEYNEAAGLEVGYYYVPVTVLKDTSDENSTMNTYVVEEARLQVTKSSLTVQLLLSNGKMIQSLSPGSQSYYCADTDYKRFTFNVKSLTDKSNATIHVIATLPDGSQLYDEKHNIRFSFGTPTKVDKWEADEKCSSTTETPPPVDPNENTDSGTEENNNNNNGGTTPKPEVKFNDIENSWAKANIERAIALNIVTGYADGSFKPNQVVNRAEFTTMIARALKLEGEVSSLQFSDNDKIGEWAKQSIQLAIAAGIISGYEDQSFRPTNNISRAEVAVMMIKALGVEPEEKYELTFADADKIPAYAKKYVAAAVKLGLIAGVGNNEFAPTKAATRAEAVTFNLRVIDYLAKK